MAATETDSSSHAFIGISGTGGGLVVDGVATTSSTGTSAWSSAVDVGDGPGGAQLLGFVCEDGAFSSALSSGNYATLNSNMHSATNGWNF